MGYTTRTVNLLAPVASSAGAAAAPAFAAGDTVFVRWRMVSDGGVTGWGMAIDNIAVQAGALPIELADFTGLYDGRKVNLAWKTAAETNNASFTVERALSGASDTWTAVGTRAGSGTTSEARSYAMADEQVPFTATSLRYRLRQTDFDGTTSYSPIVEVQVGVPTRFALHDVAPNPIRSAAKVRYEIPARAAVRLEVYDLTGRLVSRLVDEEQEAGRREVTFDAAGLASGTYVLRATAGTNSETRTLTVVR